MKRTTARKVRLSEVAYARSGDKGSSATLGVLARSPEAFDLLEKVLTEKRVLEYFAPMGCRQVKRHVLPRVRGLNFVLVDVLAGGGSRSLRIDAQGKAIGPIALRMELDLPEPPGRGIEGP